MRLFGAAMAVAAGLMAADLELVEGRPDSKVRVVIFEDLQCPDCANFRRMLDTKLLPKYSNRVAFVHRDFPLAKHSWARKAAVASRFFQRQSPKLAIEWRRHILASISDVEADTFERQLAAFAKSHGVDAGAAVAALGNEQLIANVEADVQEGVARGVSRTPTVFVNHRPYVETFTFEELAKGIDEALAETP